MEMRYFKSVKGLAFLRPGRTGIYIGCKRKPRVNGISGGFVWDTEAVTAVAAFEFKQNLRDYNDAVRDKVLIETTEIAFNAAAEKKKKDQALAAAEKKVAAANAAKKADKKNTQPTTQEG